MKISKLIESDIDFKKRIIILISNLIIFAKLLFI